MSDVQSPESRKQDFQDKKVVGIDGKWYDITDFIEKHPGGPVIEQFIGQDATGVFRAWHDFSVLKYRKPVGDYEIKDDPIKKDFEEFQDDLRDKGLYKTNFAWYHRKYFACFSLFMVSFLCIVFLPGQYKLCGAPLLAVFWQQCGFLMHDFMHTQVYKKRKTDEIMGTFFGTVCIGINGSWWKDEHNVHHALTNVIDYKSQFRDPQMYEDIWAQDKKLFPFYQTYVTWLLIKIQWITFLPLCIFAGRFGILIDGMHLEKRISQWIAFFIHWVWICIYLYQLDDMYQIIIYYIIATLGEGVLHIQLLVSHYAKPFQDKDDVHKMNFYKWQIETNINIVNPWWLDWFHGGLNFHNEHHCFPTLPRHSLKVAREGIKKICEKHGIFY